MADQGTELFADGEDTPAVFTSIDTTRPSPITVEQAMLLAQACVSDVDLKMLRLCRQLGGHSGEGTILLGRCIGRCARCGVGLLIDAS